MVAAASQNPSLQYVVLNGQITVSLQTVYVIGSQDSLVSEVHVLELSGNLGAQRTGAWLTKTPGKWRLRQPT